MPQSSEEEVKRVMVVTKLHGAVVNWHKYSCYEELKRVICWVMRFIENLKKSTSNDEKESGELKINELNNAEALLCKQAQSEMFGEDIIVLQSKGVLPKSSNLYALTPFLDEKGLVRVNGRIDAAYCLPVEARRPLILANDHPVTFLIMKHYHMKAHHLNDALVINESRQKYWVLKVRSLLKRVKQKCSICIFMRSLPAVPRMGQLPPDRLTPYVRPFTYTGVDYCGPFLVAIGRRREKRWVVLFTCMTIRAIHLEIAEDLSTDAFLVCLRNFVNRRGIPCCIRSDNGTNFIGAQAKLKAEDRFFDFKYLERQLGKLNIDWKFNCPNTGGCWERLIQCVQRLLQRVLKSDAPRLETFRSVLIEAENIVNSRPLTDIPVTPDEPEALTPNHFLMGCLNSTQTPTSSDERVCLKKQWQIAQNLKDRLWKRWVIEYLPRLLCRPKWRDEVDPLKIGQMVIIMDAALPRSQWEKGIIQEVLTAADGQVRSAVVRTNHGNLRRPASKLAALNLSESP